ncbi:unnamed protein product [Sphagnum tenellum]
MPPNQPVGLLPTTANQPLQAPSESPQGLATATAAGATTTPSVLASGSPIPGSTQSPLPTSLSTSPSLVGASAGVQAVSPLTGSMTSASSPNNLPTPGNTGPLGGIATATPPDLSVDPSGLSKATVVMTTTAGTLKFKFYPNDAHQTVERVIELISKGFYNGLTFHRVVPGFVVQGGDPLGNGTGGSGQKLKAEFNNRRHVEGTLAMARAADPNSADSQFYISLATLPHLDHNYTVFGQVVEGMEVARTLKVGDKMLSFKIE